MTRPWFRLGRIGVRMSICIGIAAVVLPAGPARAVQVLPCSLLDLCERAGLILHGQCTAVREGRDPRSGLPVRAVTLQLRQVLKASDPSVPGSRLGVDRFHSFRQYNSPSLYGCEAEPPGYARGEEVVVFLAPTSRIGLTAPIGMWQGKFRVLRTGSKRRPSYLVTNGGNNENLSINAAMLRDAGMRPRSVQAARIGALGLSGWDREILTRTDAGPLDLGRFTQLVRKLVRNPQQ